VNEKQTTVLSPTRRLVYDFLILPHIWRAEIADKMGLYDSFALDDKGIEFFKAVNNAARLDELRALVNQYQEPRR
jgi:hypothetical protein